MGKIKELLQIELVDEEKIPVPPETLKLMDDIEKEFRRVLPNGFFSAQRAKILGNPFISISMGIIGDRKDLTSGIRANDPAHFAYSIQGLDDQFNLTNNMQLTKTFGRVMINPPEGSHLAMGSVKVPFRKMKGNSDKMKKAMFKEIAKMFNAVKDNKDDIYQKDNYDKKYFKGM